MVEISYPYCTLRFNGAATLSLRKSDDVQGRQRHGSLASMGPQLYRCGNEPRDIAGSQGRTCFNGAATLSLRKSVGMTEMGERSTGASMGLQLYRCGNVVSGEKTHDMDASLQWGRNFIVAEMGQIDLACSTIPWLQWGRNFIVAEMERLSLYLSWAPWLQWGRNFIVAEIGL